MRIQSRLFKAILLTLLLPCMTAGTRAQQSSQQQDVPTLSPPIHAALYPEVMCVHCIVPEWGRGYLLHREIDKDPALVTMYDKEGKKVVEARIVPPDAAKVSVSATDATHAGGILAAGGGIMTDGSSQRFIAKTDPAGHIVQSVHTGRFTTRHVCEASDATVWALGFDFDIHDSPDADKNVLRHYSFEKGLLGSFVSLDSISKSRDASLQISTPRGGYLRCGKDRVSVYLWSAAQYIEVDASTEKLVRWKVDLSPVVGGKTNGFAVTEEGRIFVGVDSFSEPDKKRTHGLYELNAKTGTSGATLIPVDGTLTLYEPSDIPADGAFIRLWGADGDELVVHRQGDGWGVSWAKVSASPSTPD